MAIGDIVEPNETWRDFKKQKTGRDWDYVFRRLFYTSTPDITRTDFAPPVEIDTVEATGGHISNLDLRVDPDGTAHLLYLKTNLSPVLRDAFFPGRPIVTTLEHVEIAGGKVSRRTTLATGGEKARETPHYARFHVTEDGTPLGRRARLGPPARRLLLRSRTASSRSAPGDGKFTPLPLAPQDPVLHLLHRLRARRQPAVERARSLRHGARRRDAPVCAGADAVAVALHERGNRLSP